MKKLLALFIFIAVLVSLTPIFAQENSGYYFEVLTTQIKTITFEDGEQQTSMRDEYFIYYGNEESREEDERLARMGMMAFSMLIHPVPSVAKNMQFQAPKRWYVNFMDSRLRINTLVSLADKNAWDTAPQIVKHILKALSVNDPNLMIINYRTYTHSISILYHPKFDENRTFYEMKLRRINRYFNNLKDFNKEMPNPFIIE